MKIVNLVLQSLLYTVIVGGVYLIFVDFSQLKLNTADASTYLNIAENIISHKGFVVSFDLYQFFTSRYHPLWPFMHPIYPLLCSLVFMVHGGIEQVIKLNIFILGLNTAFIFYIIQTFVPSRLNIFFLACLALSFNFFYSALFPWTEQLHLLFFLISLIVFVKFSHYKRGLVLAGALNGILFLIRVSHVYNILAYVLVICIMREDIRTRLRNVILFILGFALVLGPYQLFNWLVYHSLYPQYLKPAADYTLARFSASTYKWEHIGFYNPSGFRFSFAHIGYFFDHIIELCKNFYILLIPIIVYLCMFGSKRQRFYFVLNCLCQSVCVVLGYSYSFCWDPSLEALRYALIPFVLISLAAWYCFYEVFYASGIKARKLFVVAILTILTLVSGSQYLDIRWQYMEHPRNKDPFYVDLYGSLSWINKNLPKDALVASNEDQEGYFMHRPFISMPPGKSYNCANLRLYDRIYSPDYYLLSSSISDRCFVQIAVARVFSNKTFRVLEVKKKKN